MSRKVVLFGGSFNPPHKGHAEVIRHLAKMPFDEIWVIPAFAHAFGKPLMSFDLRFKLCELMLEDLGKDGVRAHVIDVEKRLGGVSRTVDTLENLQAENPAVQFTFALGEDLRHEFPSWKNSEQIAQIAALYFFPRAGYAPDAFAPEMSSTEIRDALKQGRDLDRYLTPRVAAYLKAHKP